jgi:hypothetical protein
VITLRRAGERHHVRRRKQESWRTFHPDDRADPLADGFGVLEMLDEISLPPGAAVPHAHHEAEVVTYVLEGALAQEDSTGRSGVLYAGEFQCIRSRHSTRHSETNPSQTAWAQVFRLGLRPAAAGLEPGQEEKRFCTADRRGVLCVVASRQGRASSLRLHQDATIHSSMLDPGNHIVHDLRPGRSAWLHIVRGEANVGDVILTTGDGAGISGERAISLTALGATEILLLEIGDPALPRHEDR